MSRAARTKRQRPRATTPKPYKDDLKQARRACLALWLDRLRAADDRHRKEREKFPRGDIPDLTMPYPSRDMFDLLVKGIGAALAGKKNPFSIASGNNNKTKLDRATRGEAVAKVILLMRSASWEDACSKVADEFGVEPKTIQDAYSRSRLTQDEEQIRKLWAESSRSIRQIGRDNGVT